jgi:hypothetical protein
MVTIINQPSVQKDSFLAAVLPDVIKNDGTPQTYYFGEQLHVGDVGEEIFERFCKKWITQGKMTEITDLRKFTEYQKKDCDYACTYPNGKKLLMEVKCDTRKTGNLFAESIVTSYVNGEDGIAEKNGCKPGWLYGSESDYVFYAFPGLDVAYLINRRQLASFVDHCMLPACMQLEGSYVSPFKVRAAYNCDKRRPNEFRFGIGYCVPLREIENAEMMRGCWAKYCISTMSSSFSTSTTVKVG